jgi:hypothetical protein
MLALLRASGVMVPERQVEDMRNASIRQSVEQIRSRKTVNRCKDAPKRFNLAPPAD